MRRGFYRRDTKENGITLIALVVTIIILLILAGVAIGAVVGDNGLFRKAKESVNTWKDAEGREKGTLDEFSSAIDDNFSNKTKVNYKKTPIKAGEDTLGVRIDFTVNTPTVEIELASREEFNESVKRLVIGKSNEELEEMLDNLIKNAQGEYPYETKDLNGYFKFYGVDSLYGLSRKYRFPYDDWQRHRCKY